MEGVKEWEGKRDGVEGRKEGNGGSGGKERE